MNQEDATVFYVDDNAKAQRLLGSLMTACGFRVITASNPLEAIARYAGLRFDLALLDYRMPFLSGSQWQEKLRARNKILSRPAKPSPEARCAAVNFRIADNPTAKAIL